MKIQGIKTNPMRILEKSNISFSSHSYNINCGIDGISVAKNLNLDMNQVFKTLVTEGKSGNFFVFLVPVSSELHLKKAAKAVGEKSISMIKQNKLRPLTGYVHGGCSPIGMKKPFPTIIHEDALNYESIFFSGGQIGCQIRCNPIDLQTLINASFADII